MARVATTWLLAASQLTLTAWADAQEVAPARSARPEVQKQVQSTPGAPLRTRKKADALPGDATPRASRVPVKPLLLFDEKGIGLGCAEP